MFIFNDDSITFPRHHPVKIIGNAGDLTESIALSVIQMHFPTFNNDYSKQASQDNKYVTLTFEVWAESEEQLSAAHQKLLKTSEILMVI